MLRIANITLLILTCSVLSAWAQTDAPERQPVTIQRGTRTSPPIGIGNPSRQSDTSALPSNTSEPSQSRQAASVTPPFVPEPVQVIPTKEGENGHIRTVCRLGFIPAKNAAETLIKIFKTEGESMSEPVKNKVVIVPEVLSNCLIVSGPPAAVDEVRRLVSEMDRPAVVVRLEVQLTEVVSDKEKKAADDSDAAKSKTADDTTSKKSPEKTEEGPLMHAEFSTLDGQQAYIQFGRTEAHIRGTSSNSLGMTNTVTQMQVGSTVQMTPRVAPGGIVVLELSIQDSRSGPMEEGAIIATLKDGSSIRSPNTDMLINKTTLQLQDGQTQTISTMTRNGKARRIAVTAHIIHPGAEK
ncbi:MAG: secretin N-terminal domain-containing protein [Thermoguttaceae bacterium]